MRPIDARSEISHINSLLLDLDLAVAVNPLVPMRYGDRLRLTWPSAKLAAGVFNDFGFGSIAEYAKYLREGHYTSLLRDGGLLQISFDFKDDVLAGYRFCFYPCPLVLPPNEDSVDWDVFIQLLVDDLYDHIEMCESWENDTEGTQVSTNSQHQRLRLQAPIRFDFARDTDPPEPASHVHIGYPESRIPVYAPLSAGHFLHFVISHFYPGHGSLLERVKIHHHDRCIDITDECALHFNCRRSP
jgi:hypothetical protein